ncbi:MAG: ABC transporter permease [Candidatus Limivicinus sp.]|jgi:NitT/TauT family transport system permease protein
MQNKARNFPKWLRTAAVGIFWLAVWQLSYYAVGSGLLLASPADTLKRLLSMVAEGEFWLIIGSSFLRIMWGFFTGLVLGIILAVAAAKWKTVHSLLQLPMNIIKATPVASFVILALIWISGRRLSSFISFLMVLPMVWSNVYEGIRAADPKLLELAKVYRLTAFQKLKAVYIPAVMPYLLSVSRVAMGFAWKAGIAGEVIAVPKNTIGAQLYDAKVYLETTDLFAWTVVIIALSVIIEKLFTALMKKLSGKWGALNG